MTDKPNQTRSIHGGEEEGHAYNSVTVPIVQSTTYRIDSTAALKKHVSGEEPIHDYSRYTNPTIEAAERKVAALESAEDAIVTSSGMSALSTVFLAILKPGHHVVYMGDFYRPSGDMIQGLLGRFGVTSSSVPYGDYDALEQELKDKQPRLLFCEIPSNPHLRVLDLPRVAQMKEHVKRLKIFVDGTFSGPANFRPLAQGADLLSYSLTKYHAGHNDVTAGAVLGSTGMIEAIREIRGLIGTVLDPQSAYLLNRGMKTYSLRMKQHNETASKLARFLEEHDAVGDVFYPGLESHPDYEIANRLLEGFGGVISFVVRGGLEAGSKVVDKVRCIQHAASLGGVESLIHQPAVFTYSDIPPEMREMMGIEDGLLRLSVGLEEFEDLNDDLNQALSPD
jgi:cystathionine gamma-synthase